MQIQNFLSTISFFIISKKAKKSKFLIINSWCIFEGNDKEKLDWFKTINNAGEKLTDQELRNAIYTGTWLTDAKKYFSKSGCPAYNL